MPQRITASVALLLSAVSGLGAGVAGLLITLVVTEHRGASLAAGGLAGAVVSAAGAWQAARRLADRPRRRQAIAAATAGAALLAFAGVLWGLILSPAPRATEAMLAAPAFWDLPTGSRIAYEATQAAGTARPTPVLLVHGGPGSPTRDVAGIGPLLAGLGFDVYNYHQVGSGLSSRLDAEDYSVARHVADLEAIRQTLRAERVILIGTSWGGQLTAAYLAAYPERVERAVVVSPGAIWVPAFSDTERLTPGGKRDVDGVVSSIPRFLLPHILMSVVGPGPTQALLPDKQVDGLAETMMLNLDMWAGCERADPVQNRTSAGGIGFWANAATIFDARSVVDPRPLLANLETPILILRGECDYVAWEVAREYRDLLRNAVLIPIAGAGHVIQQDQPQRYREIIRAFILGEPLPAEPYTGDAPPW